MNSVSLFKDLNYKDIFFIYRDGQPVFPAQKSDSVANDISPKISPSVNGIFYTFILTPIYLFIHCFFNSDFALCVRIS